MRPTEAEFIWGRWQGSEADPCTPPNIRAIISHLFSSSFPGMGGGGHTGRDTQPNKKKTTHPQQNKLKKKKIKPTRDHHLSTFDETKQSDAPQAWSCH